MKIFKISQNLNDELSLDIDEPIKERSPNDSLDLNEKPIKVVKPKNNASSLKGKIINLYSENPNLVSSINRHLIDMTNRFFMADDITLNTKGKILAYLGGNYKPSKEEQELFQNVSYRDLVNIGLFKIVDQNRETVLKSAFNDIRNFY